MLRCIILTAREHPLVQEETMHSHCRPVLHASYSVVMLVWLPRCRWTDWHGLGTRAQQGERSCIEACTIRTAWTREILFIIWCYMSWQWWPKASIHGSWIHGYRSKVPCVAKWRNSCTLRPFDCPGSIWFFCFANFIYRRFTCFTSLSSWQVWSNEHVPSRRRPWPRPAFSILRPI